MRILTLTLCLLLTGMAKSQDYKVISHADHAEIISTKYGFRVQAPIHWYASATNPTPYAFSYPPRDMRFAQVGVPRNGADLAIVADDKRHFTQAIDTWIQAKKEAWGYFPSRILERSSTL